MNLKQLSTYESLAGGYKVREEDEVEVENDWLRETLEREGQSHRDFFGQEFDLSDFERILNEYGQERIREWQRLGLEPHFLPDLYLAQNDSYPNWKVRLEKWYHDKSVEGKILRSINGRLQADKEAFKLEGIVVLIDTRLKPAYADGKQVYENDNLLGPIIEELRKEGTIAAFEYGSQSSRFGLSSSEWEGYVKSRLAEKLDLRSDQLRLERAIEANIIPQLYPHMPRKDDSRTNTWIWYEEYFGSDNRRLHGGITGHGAPVLLAFVCCRWPGDSPDRHWQCRSLRPLAVL
jgi:hypothetical protein